VSGKAYYFATDEASKITKKIMDFVFSKEQELTLAKQALELLNSEKSSEEIAFTEKLVAQGWTKFEKETVYFYGITSVIYWWLVHPSIAGLEWQDSDYDPEENGVDTALYYELSCPLLANTTAKHHT